MSLSNIRFGRINFHRVDLPQGKIPFILTPNDQNPSIQLDGVDTSKRDILVGMGTRLFGTDHAAIDTYVSAAVVSAAHNLSQLKGFVAGNVGNHTLRVSSKISQGYFHTPNVEIEGTLTGQPI